MSTRSATPGNLVTTGAGEAWYAEPREKRALTFQLLGVAGQQRHFRPEALTWRGNPATPRSLKIIRRLHSDMTNFPVTAELGSQGFCCVDIVDSEGTLEHVHLDQPSSAIRMRFKQKHSVLLCPSCEAP